MTTYEENKVQLVVNRMDNDCYGHLSSKSNDEIYIVSSNPSGVVKIDLDAVDIVQASVSTMASSIAGLASSVSAMASTIAVKRDYDDLTYNDKTVRAPTYGIGKMIATASDGQTDPIVMDTFFIHENPSDPSDSLGSTWYAANSVFAGTTDGTNFTLVNISFQTLATFTKTQLLAGEVTFTYDNKEWTLTAELGDGMVDKFDITINTFTWHTDHYDYDPQTKTSKWWNQQDGFFLTRSWTGSVSLSNYWQASLYRGDDGVHGNVLVASFNIGGTMGYRAGGYVPSFTYGDITQSIEWQVAGYPCQGTFGFSECVPFRTSQLINDSQFVRQSDLQSKRDYLDLTYSTTVPAETIDNSKLVWDDKDPLYYEKLTFNVNDSVAGEENLVWNDGANCWIDDGMQNFQVWYAEDYGQDPSEGKFVLIDGAGPCLQFDLEDGVNEQTFNYESENWQSTGTLTMTFTGEPAYQVNDTLALDSNLNAVSASVSTLSSQVSSITTTLGSYATQAYVNAQIGAMLSSQL